MFWTSFCHAWDLNWRRPVFGCWKADYQRKWSRDTRRYESTRKMQICLWVPPEQRRLRIYMEINISRRLKETDDSNPAVDYFSPFSILSIYNQFLHWYGFTKTMLMVSPILSEGLYFPYLTTRDSFGAESCHARELPHNTLFMAKLPNGLLRRYGAKLLLFSPFFLFFTYISPMRHGDKWDITSVASDTSVLYDGRGVRAETLLLRPREGSSNAVGKTASGRESARGVSSFPRGAWVLHQCYAAKGKNIAHPPPVPASLTVAKTPLLFVCIFLWVVVKKRVGSLESCCYQQPPSPWRKYAGLYTTNFFYWEIILGLFLFWRLDAIMSLHYLL